MIISSAHESGILDLFRQAVPDEFFDQLQKNLGLPVRQRLFTLPLVVWMMVSQRLNPKATLSTSESEKGP